MRDEVIFVDECAYSVKQLADMSGVSVRTLHHYEGLGLLKPARKPNGYRAYDARDVERLQQVLLFRACGMELAQIRELMDSPGYDARAALERHLELLVERKRELKQLIAATRRTIWSIEEGVPMEDAARFEGLKHDAIRANEAAFGAEARQRFGDEAVDEANERLLAMDEGTWNDMNELEGAIIEQLKQVMAEGDAHGEAAAGLARMHARWIELHWGTGAYSREAHLALAQGYLADDRFRAYYDERAGEGATEMLVEVLEENL